MNIFSSDLLFIYNKYAAQEDHVKVSVQEGDIVDMNVVMAKEGTAHPVEFETIIFFY